MNSFTRVAISVLLLGACAIAMRFSMVSKEFSIPLFQEPRFGLSVGDNVKLRIETSEMTDSIRLEKRNALGIRLTQTTNNFLALERFETSKEGKKQFVTADFQLHSRSGKYILGLPKFNNPLFVQIPPKIPTEIFAILISPQIDLDFRGLEISKFDLNPKLATRRNIALKVVASDMKTNSQLILRTQNRPVEIKIPKGARGTFGLEARGAASIDLFIEKGVNPRIIIYSTDKNVSPTTHVGYSTSLSSTISFDGEKVVSSREGNVTYEEPRKENPSAELYKPSEPKFDYTIRIVVDSNIQKINIQEVYSI